MKLIAKALVIFSCLFVSPAVFAINTISCDSLTYEVVKTDPASTFWGAAFWNKPVLTYTFDAQIISDNTVKVNGIIYELQDNSVSNQISPFLMRQGYLWHIKLVPPLAEGPILLINLLQQMQNTKHYYCK